LARGSYCSGVFNGKDASTAYACRLFNSASFRFVDYSDMSLYFSLADDLSTFDDILVCTGAGEEILSFFKGKWGTGGFLTLF